MLRNPLYSDDYKPTFSGHETFPLRYGWLKKAYDTVAALPLDIVGRDLFTDEAAIGRFGVGKNMVTAIRHWAVCTSIIADSGRGHLTPAPLGDLLCSPNGVDPYLEHPGTLWLLHWQLASYDPVNRRPNKTTWQWVFNHFPGLAFEKTDLVAGLTKIAETRAWSKLAPITIERDVECLLRTYESKPNDKETIEDVLSSPLAELALIRGHHRRYQLIRGPKPSLPNAVFIWALENYWRRLGVIRTLSFESIAHAPGSPGRVFLLDEVDLGERLLALEDETHGAFKWSETAGLKQVLRIETLDDPALFKLLSRCLSNRSVKKAA